MTLADGDEQAKQKYNKTTNWKVYTGVLSTCWSERSSAGRTEQECGMTPIAVSRRGVGGLFSVSPQQFDSTPEAFPLVSWV
jgi:hypothetical protein